MLLAPYSISVDDDNISGSCFRQPVFEIASTPAGRRAFALPRRCSETGRRILKFFPNGYLQVPFFLFISRLTNDARRTATRQIGE